MEHSTMTFVRVSREKRYQIDFLLILPALLIAIAIFIFPTRISANDSTAALGAGGIELQKSDDIRILEEVLEISPYNIRVKYRFLNESEQDIHTKVAFPLPLYNGVAHSNVSIADPGGIFSSFKVSVDGNPVVLKRERKALLKNRDITRKLRKLGLSDKEIFFDVADREKGELWSKLKELLPEIGQWWDISYTVYWDMKFPTGKEIIVEHEYAPAVGGGYNVVTVGTIEGKFNEFPKSQEEKMDELWRFTGTENIKKEACIDAITKRAIEKKADRALAVLPQEKSGMLASYDRVEYILGTGRNWKGPIGEFTLRLVKQKPEDFVSLCFPGKPEKISSTVYEFKQKDFVPQDKLTVYFFKFN
ncbi:DUF4424 domain-containing protein [Desulfomonile tiedjei]|nr:DUF4424 domain-containing protein [Desulfomonile tiedjei]